MVNVNWKETLNLSKSLFLVSTGRTHKWILNLCSLVSWCVCTYEYAHICDFSPEVFRTSPFVKWLICYVCNLFFFIFIYGIIMVFQDIHLTR